MHSYAREMTSAAKKILEDALALPPEAREELVGALSQSLDSVELSPAWQAEIERRLQRLTSGDAVVLDAEEHLGKLLAKYA